jgi:hypothetical protein
LRACWPARRPSLGLRITHVASGRNAALACNQQALSIMDFGMPRKLREIILEKMGGVS